MLLKQTMIETLISSKTRVKLLLKFFLNSATKSYLRNLETEFGESTNAIRLELNKFEKAGMLETEFVGNKKLFKANTAHPLYKDINNIVFKYIGLDWIVDYVVSKLGELEKVYLVGSFARGIDSDKIELVFLGHINESFLNELCEKIEKKISKKVSYKIQENEQSLEDYALLLWRKEK